MSARTDIRKAVVTELETALSGNTVLDSFVNILPEDQLPAAVVFGTDEEVLRDEGYMGDPAPTYNRALTIRIELHEVGVDGLGVMDTLEVMLETAETALYASASLEALTRDFYLSTVEADMSAEAGDTRGVLAALFTAEYERAG